MKTRPPRELRFATRLFTSNEARVVSGAADENAQGRDLWEETPPSQN